jgi:hypothetical protein
VHKLEVISTPESTDGGLLRCCHGLKDMQDMHRFKLQRCIRLPGPIRGPARSEAMRTGYNCPCATNLRAIQWQSSMLLIVCMGSACIALNAGLPPTTMARPVSVRVMAVSSQSDESISEVQDLIYESVWQYCACKSRLCLLIVWLQLFFWKFCSYDWYESLK